GIVLYTVVCIRAAVPTRTIQSIQARWRCICRTAQHIYSPDYLLQAISTVEEVMSMYRSRLTPVRLLLFVLPLILLYLTACVPKLTPNLSHQGQLLNENGSPVADGDYEIVYSIFQAATGGTAVYTETDTVTVEN